MPTIAPTALRRGAAVLALAAGAALLAPSPATGLSLAPTVENPVVVGHSVDRVELGFGSVWALGERRLTQVDPVRQRVRRASRPFPRPGVDLAVGSGAVWVRTTAALWRVDPTTSARTKVDDVRGRGPVAAADGEVWFSADGGGAVRRLDATGATPVGAAIPMPGNVGAIVIGGGFVWVSAKRVPTVWQLDPSDGRIVATHCLVEDCARPPDRFDLDPGIGQIEFADGTLWASVDFGPSERSQLVGLDAATGSVAHRAEEPFRHDRGTEAESDSRGLAVVGGTVWWARAEFNDENGGFLGPSGVWRYVVGAPGAAGANRFFPAAARTLSEIAWEPYHPRDLAADSDAAWMATSAGVTRLATDGVRAPTTRIRGLRGVAVARNRVWVLLDRGLRRVNPRNGRPTGRLIPLRGRALHGANGWVWLQSRNQRTVRRIHPRTGRVTAVIRLRRPVVDDPLAFPAWGVAQHQSGANRLTAHAPGRRRALFGRSVPDAQVTELGARGAALWMAADATRPAEANRFDDPAFGGVTRFDRRGRRGATKRFQLRNAPEFVPIAMAIGPRNAWVADQADGLFRVATRGRSAGHVPTGALPSALAVHRNDVWVVAAESGSLHRHDRRTGRPKAPGIALPSVDLFRTTVAVGARAVWVAPLAGGALARVPLR